MPIRQMINTRDPDGTPREFQSQLAVLGKVRIGVFATPEGKRGRPEKIDTFRFTSPTEGLIRGAAELYGGTPELWTPQGSRTPQWAVVSDAKALPVYLVNGQDIDPNYEAWGGGRTCLRRCDGVWNRIGGDDGRGTPCVCNGPSRPADKDLCKITLRVQIMLQELPGIGSWLFETHGENATAEISKFAPLVKNAPMPVPAILRLREESRREWDPNRKVDGKIVPGFVSRSFYVPWFDISFLTAQQVAVGGDALTQALVAAGAPAALGSGEPVRALEAAPTTHAIVIGNWLEAMDRATDMADLDDIREDIAGQHAAGRVTDDTYGKLGTAWVEAKDRVLAAGHGSALAQAAAPELAAIHEANPVAKLAEALDNQDPGLVAMAEKNGLSVAEARAAILAQIEACDTTGAIEDLVGKLKAKDIGDKAIKDAAKSRYAAIVAAAEVGGSAPGATSVTANADHQRALRDAAMRGGREFFTGEAEQYDEAVRRGATHAQIVEEGGPVHWLAGDDQRRDAEVITAQVVDGQGPPPEWAVGDTVTVGGTTFTKIGEDPFAAPAPAGGWNLDTELNAVYMASGARNWTTTQANEAIRRAAGVEKMSQLDESHAEALHALAADITAGQVAP